MRYLKYNLRFSQKVRISLSVLFWILSFICMAIIFKFSSQNGETSQQVSDSFAAKFLSLLNDLVGINVIRKMAHFSEYAALAFFLGCAMSFTREKFSVLIPFILSVIYSISDEVHQLFVPERAGRVFDVFVDSCGVAAGLIVFTLIFMLISFIAIKTAQKKEFV